MSCFIMREDSLASVAAFAADALTQAEVCGSSNTYGPALSDALLCKFRCLGFYNAVRREYDAKAIYRALYALNVSAYNGRYKDSGDTAAPDLDPYDHRIHKPFVWLGDCKYSLQGWEAQICGSIDCWLYQTDEDATAASPLRDAMWNLNRCIYNFIIHNQPSYKWG